MFRVILSAQGCGPGGLRRKITLKACHPEPQAKDRSVLVQYDPSVAPLPQDDR